MIDLKLESKSSIGKIVINDALQRFKAPTVVWSAGKDSTVVLDLVRKVVAENGLKVPPVLFIDHGDHFQETWDMLHKYTSEWNLKLIIAKNDKVINAVRDGYINLSEIGEENVAEAKKVGFSGDSFPYSLDTDVGNHLLKTVAMNQAIRKYGFDALFTGIRWDENEARSTEKFLSPRDTPPHTRVHPILTFRERDIWATCLNMICQYIPNTVRVIDPSMASKIQPKQVTNLHGNKTWKAQRRGQEDHRIRKV